jgi:hypothetical protein
MRSPHPGQHHRPQILVHRLAADPELPRQSSHLLTSRALLKIKNLLAS